MGASAGGSNVTGVQSIEQGVLKMGNADISITGTGTFTGSLACPAGKKYIIKATKCFQVDGTYTLTTREFRIKPTGLNGVAIASGTADFSYALTLPITLSAGDSIEVYVNCPTTYSVTGTYRFFVLYQEVTI
jgi:hypothetical protein